MFELLALIIGKLCVDLIVTFSCLSICFCFQNDLYISVLFVFVITIIICITTFILEKKRPEVRWRGRADPNIAVINICRLLFTQFRATLASSCNAVWRDGDVWRSAGQREGTWFWFRHFPYGVYGEAFPLKKFWHCTIAVWLPSLFLQLKKLIQSEQS